MKTQKSNLTFLTVAIAIFFLTNYLTVAQFGGGNGTVNNPYKIYTKKHLEELDDSVSNSPLNDYETNFNWSRNKHFKLMNNINDTVKITIGYAWNSTEFEDCFQGSFNGNSKKIILALDGGYCVGLFSAAYKANIYDLSVEGYVNGMMFIGGICGNIGESNISDCINNCNIIGLNDDFGNNSDAGGICGNISESSISDCINNGNIIGYGRIGGICGNAAYSNVENCINYGNISSHSNTGIYIGGICGLLFLESSMSNCRNYGNIKAEDSYAGGIAGGFGYNSNISSCENYGNVKANEAVGGITGCIDNDYYPPFSTLTNCLNNGDISGVLGVGGISGHTHRSTEISNCLNTGTVSADSFVGGIAGGYDNSFALKNGNIYNSVNSGLVIGKNIVGGIIGRCLGEVKNCINSGTVSGNSSLGCIVGEKGESAIIENCFFDKQVCGK